MKFLYTIVLILTTAFLFGCKKDKTTYVDGTVVDAQTNSPLPNSTVYLEAENTRWCFLGCPYERIETITSDADGNFLFTFEAKNKFNYYITAEYPEYSMCGSTLAIESRENNTSKIIHLCPPYNYFACKVNGVDWESCEPNWLGGYSTYVTAQYVANSYLDINGMDICSSKSIEIYIKIDDFTGIGSYLLGGSNIYNEGHINGPKRNEYGGLLVHSTDSSHAGIITINEFDNAKQKIYGTFQFTAFNKDSNEVVNVTDGKIINVYFL